MTENQESAAVSPVRVAVVQFEPQVGVENLKKNALAVEQRLIAAADNGAGLVVLPELATTGYVFDTREEAFAHSESVPEGPSVEMFARIAAERDLYVVGCVVERDGEQLFDTAVLVGTGCGTGSGLWIAKKDSDVIVYGADATEWHAEHIVAHELGHMLLGHGPAPDRDADLPNAETLAAVTELLPSIAPESIRHVLGRTDYGSMRERDAETFADMVMLQAMRSQRRDSLLHRTFFRDRRH